MPIFISLRLANSSIISDKHKNTKKNPSVLIYKIFVFALNLEKIDGSYDHIRGEYFP